MERKVSSGSLEALIQFAKLKVSKVQSSLDFPPEIQLRDTHFALHCS
jgi:hypothetical protein